MQNQTIDENDEVHEDIIDELEYMDDSAQNRKFRSVDVRRQTLEVRSQKLHYNGS